MKLKKPEVICKEFSILDVPPDTNLLVRNIIRIVKKLETSPQDKIEVGKAIKELKGLEERVLVLEVIRKQYEQKFGIRMYANGDFKEIEAKPLSFLFFRTINIAYSEIIF